MREDVVLQEWAGTSMRDCSPEVTHAEQRKMSK